MLTFLDINIDDPGLTLMLFSNGLVMLEPSVFNFFPTYHYGHDGVVNIFSRDGYSLSDADGVLQHYDYGVAYPYKEMPALKRWLVEQNLQRN
jgi:hypothetical protein